MANCFDLVIFGGTGDLSRRKLLPALYNGLASGLVEKGSRIILTSRRALDGSVEDWLRGVLETFVPACGLTEAGLKAFAEIVELRTLELNQGGDAWAEMAKSLLPARPERPLVHFLAIPPKLFSDTCVLLGEYGLNHAHARVVIEKPLGHDRASAAEINTQVAEQFAEDQTFRIDHYLGKEAVQNLLALRFSNFLFEQVWNANCIDHVQITIAEHHGVEGRGAFYEGVGAMRDMVQNHLLQLLCLVAMEPPARLEADAIRDEKLKVLRALEPLVDEMIDERVVRGQYEAGAIAGEAVKSYGDDLDLAEPSRTESYVAIKAHIENWRWGGVPFYLRTGKRLPSQFAEIVLQFKPVPHVPNSAWGANVSPNRFIISLQPDDRLAMRMMVKDHARGSDKLKEVELNLDMRYGEDAPRLGPYLRLILDAAEGDQSLFVHRDEVDLAWTWVDRIIDHWSNDTEPLKGYAAGTWGPYEAHELMARDGRAWTKLLTKQSGS